MTLVELLLDHPLVTSILLATGALVWLAVIVAVLAFISTFVALRITDRWEAPEVEPVSSAAVAAAARDEFMGKLPIEGGGER